MSRLLNERRLLLPALIPHLTNQSNQLIEFMHMFFAPVFVAVWMVLNSPASQAQQEISDLAHDEELIELIAGTWSHRREVNEHTLFSEFMLNGRYRMFSKGRTAQRGRIWLFRDMADLCESYDLYKEQGYINPRKDFDRVKGAGRCQPREERYFGMLMSIESFGKFPPYHYQAFKWRIREGGELELYQAVGGNGGGSYHRNPVPDSFALPPADKDRSKRQFVDFYALTTYRPTAAKSYLENYSAAVRRLDEILLDTGWNARYQFAAVDVCEMDELRNPALLVLEGLRGTATSSDQEKAAAREIRAIAAMTPEIDSHFVRVEMSLDCKRLGHKPRWAVYE